MFHILKLITQLINHISEIGRDKAKDIQNACVVNTYNHALVGKRQEDLSNYAIVSISF